MAWLGRDHDNDAQRIAANLGLHADLLEAGFAYAKAYPDEIAEALAEQDRDFDELKQILPNLELVTVHVTPP